MTGSSSQLKWSAPLASIAAQLYGEAPVSFFVEQGRMLRRQRVDFLLVPLRHCVALGSADAGAPLGASRDHWVLWQSATRGAVPTLLPTEPQALARALGLESAGDAVTVARQAVIGDAVAVARQAVIELVEAIYQERAV
jgi:hypothetical protein